MATKWFLCECKMWKMLMKIKCLVLLTDTIWRPYETQLQIQVILNIFLLTCQSCTITEAISSNRFMWHEGTFNNHCREMYTNYLLHGVQCRNTSTAEQADFLSIMTSFARPLLFDFPHWEPLAPSVELVASH